MYCSNCGKELNDNADVCIYCGAFTNKNNNKRTNVEQKEFNTVALVGFIFSFFFPLVGFILGLIGMGKAKKTNSGIGFAIAAVLLSLIFILINIIVFGIYLLPLILYYFEEPVEETMAIMAII